MLRSGQAMTKYESVKYQYEIKSKSMLKEMDALELFKGHNVCK